MFKKWLLAGAAAAAFGMVMFSSPVAEAGGPPGYRGRGHAVHRGPHHGHLHPHGYPRYSYNVPGRRHGYNVPGPRHGYYTPSPYWQPYGLRSRYSSFYSPYGYSPYSRSGFFYSSPGFSLRIGR